MEDFRKKNRRMDDMKPYALGFQTCKFVDDKMYFPSFVGNALFCYDHGKVEFLGKFPSEKETYCIKLFLGMEEYDEKLIFAPQVANHIAVYDLETGVFSQINVDIDWSGVRSKFGEAIIKEHILYMFPIRFNGVVGVDLKTGHAEIYDNWISKVNHNALSNSDAYCGFGKAIRGNRVFLPICKSNQVLEFDLDSRISTIHDVGEEGHAAICDDGQYLWLFPRRGQDIIKWNPETGQCETLQPQNDEVVCASFVGAIYSSGYVYAFPEYGNQVLMIDVKRNEISEFKALAEECSAISQIREVHNSAFVFSTIHDNKIVVSSGKSSEMILADLSMTDIERIRLPILSECEKYFSDMYAEKSKLLFQEIFNNTNIIGENAAYGLKGFIEYVGIRENSLWGVVDNEGDLWGRKIWEAVV